MSATIQMQPGGFHFHTQPIFLQPAREVEPMSFLSDIAASLGQMKDIYKAPLRSPVPKNPCASDIARTGCKDAQCLKRYAESLSGSCAELLLRPSLKPVPEPSPAPMPSHRGYGAAADLVSALLGQHEPKKAGRYPTASIGDDPHYLQNLHTRRAADADEGQGFFTMVTTDGEGHSKTVSGPIGSMPTLPPELAQLTQMIPDLPDIASSLFGAFAMPQLQPEPGTREYPTASIGDDPEEVAAWERAKHHPCGQEIMMCRQTVGGEQDAVKQCLLSHLEQLSPRCKCFVNQVEGPEKMQRMLPPSAKAAAAPTVHAISAPQLREQPMRVVVEIDDVVRDPRFPARPHTAPVHGGPCVFMMTATLVLFALVLRKCILCCCRPRAPAPHMAVVVPPEQTSIKLVEPLMVADIKMVPETKA